jgi:two-component system chemotaxis response regulator CheY
MRALVIDDSSAMRRIIAGILKSVGFDTTEAVNGRDGLARLGPPGQFDLALVDWNMPEMNGFEFVTAVRADPTHAGLRIVMVTTESDVAQMVRVLNAGANEYVMKPFDRDILLSKLELLGFDATSVAPGRDSHG